MDNWMQRYIGFLQVKVDGSALNARDDMQSKLPCHQFHHVFIPL